MVMGMRMMGRVATALLMTLAIAAASPKVDWTRRVADTGVGVRMGNPAARTRLVEYGSFNCPHCAAFARASDDDIKRLVRSGSLSFEFRPKLLFPHDPPATAIARCVGPERFFDFTADYMREAPAIGDRLTEAFLDKADEIEAARAAGVGPLARKYAALGGMGTVAARHGLDAGALARCLSNKAVLGKIEANEAAATKAGVSGTPTFFINGRRAEFADVQKLGIAR